MIGQIRLSTVTTASLDNRRSSVRESAFGLERCVTVSLEFLKLIFYSLFISSVISINKLIRYVHMQADRLLFVYSYHLSR